MMIALKPRDREGRLPLGAAVSRRVLLAAMLLCIVSATVGCGRWTRPAGALSSELPRADEVVAVVNRNAQIVRSLLVNDLDISVHERGHITMPFDGKMAFEKPRRFRLTANTAFSRGADLGSNDREFWAYIRSGDRPVLVHATYADYERARRSLPIHPEWIIEALGVTELPSDEEPMVLPGKRGTVELVTPTTTPQGQPATRITVVDRKSGWIMAQHLEVAGHRIASAILSRHTKDPVFGAVIPRMIVVQWPESGLEVTLRLKEVTVNPTFEPAWAEKLWRMPREVIAAGAEEVDLSARSSSRSSAKAAVPNVQLSPNLHPTLP